MPTQPTTNNLEGEFPKGKDNYCPRCYFEDDIKILKVDCKHNKKDKGNESL